MDDTLTALLSDGALHFLMIRYEPDGVRVVYVDSERVE